MDDIFEYHEGYIYANEPFSLKNFCLIHCALYLPWVDWEEENIPGELKEKIIAKKKLATSINRAPDSKRRYGKRTYNYYGNSRRFFCILAIDNQTDELLEARFIYTGLAPPLIMYNPYEIVEKYGKIMLMMDCIEVNFDVS